MKTTTSPQISAQKPSARNAVAAQGFSSAMLTTSGDCDLDKINGEIKQKQFDIENIALVLFGLKNNVLGALAKFEDAIYKGFKFENFQKFLDFIGSDVWNKKFNNPVGLQKTEEAKQKLQDYNDANAKKTLLEKEKRELEGIRDKCIKEQEQRKRVFVPSKDRVPVESKDNEFSIIPQPINPFSWLNPTGQPSPAYVYVMPKSALDGIEFGKSPVPKNAIKVNEEPVTWNFPVTADDLKTAGAVVLGGAAIVGGVAAAIALLPAEAVVVGVVVVAGVIVAVLPGEVQAAPKRNVTSNTFPDDIDARFDGQMQGLHLQKTGAGATGEYEDMRTGKNTIVGNAPTAPQIIPSRAGVFMDDEGKLYVLSYFSKGAFSKTIPKPQNFKLDDAAVERINAKIDERNKNGAKLRRVTTSTPVGAINIPKAFKGSVSDATGAQIWDEASQSWK